MEALQRLPETLEATYVETLQKFDKYQTSSKAAIEGALKLLMCAERNLKVDELLGAIAISQDGHIVTFQAMDIVRMSRSLIVLDQAQELQMFRFAHLSVREFLETQPHYAGESAHCSVAQICLIHRLGIRCFPAVVQTTFRENSAKLALLQRFTERFERYSIDYWARHSKKAGFQRGTGSLQVLFSKFLLGVEDNKNPFEEWERNVRKALHYYYSDRPLRKEHKHCISFPANPLFVVCTYGFVEILDRLLELTSNFLDCQIANGMNGLEIAAYHGHYEVTRELFKRATKLRSPLSWGSNLMTRAAKGGPTTQVMQFLLCEFQDVPISTESIVAAAQNKSCSGEAMRLLLSRFENFEMSEGVAEAVAAKCQTAEALQLLLPHSKGTETMEAMLRAVLSSSDCSAEMVGLFLVHGDNITVTSEMVVLFLSNSLPRRTDNVKILDILFLHQPDCPINLRAIRIAAAWGNEEVIRLLLSRSKNINIGEDTLVEAATNQTSGKAIIAMLLERSNKLEVTEWVLDSALGNPVQAQEVLELLLPQSQSVDAFTDLLTFGPVNPRQGGFIPLLRTSCPNAEITEHILECGASDARLEDMVLLLAQPRAVPITEQILLVAAENQFCATEMTRLILQHIDNTLPSEALMFAVVGNHYRGHELFKLMLEYFETVPVTNNVLELAIKTCGLGIAELLEELFAHSGKHEVNQELLTAGAASNAEVMNILMRHSRVINVSEAVIKAAIPDYVNEKIGRYGNEMLQLLLSQPHRAPITGAILEIAASKSDERVVRMLLARAESSTITPSLITAAAGNSRRGSRIVLLLMSSGAVKVPEEAFLAAARNEGLGREGYTILKVLFAESGQVPVTEELAIAAANNGQSGTDLMRFLLSQSPNLNINERILVAAAKNTKSGDAVLQFLLDQLDEYACITEEVLKAAAGNGHSGKGIFEILVTKAKDITITEQVIEAAACAQPPEGYWPVHTWSIRHVMKYLLQQSTADITEEAIKLAASNKTSGRQLMNLILPHPQNKLSLTPQVIKAVMANTQHGESILKLVIEKRPTELHLTREVISIAAQNDGCGKPILQRLLGHVAEWGNRKIVHKLMDAIGSKPHGFRDALFKVAYRGQKAAVEALLDAGASLNESTKDLGNVLHIAAFCGQYEVVQLLVNRGANVNAPGGPHDNALNAACHRSHIEIAKSLVEAGAEIDNQDTMGRTALHRSLRSCNIPTTDCLLELRSSLLTADCQQCSAIHHAVYGGFAYGVRTLIQAGVSVNAVDSLGWNALHWAARKGDVEVVEMLVRAGADGNKTDLRGRSPLELAIFFNNDHLCYALSSFSEVPDFKPDFVTDERICDFCEFVSFHEFNAEPKYVSDGA